MNHKPQLAFDYCSSSVQTATEICVINDHRVQSTPVYDTYWEFAARRQEIFFARAANQKPPWTEDPILQKHKFTNAYRASDRVSQYLIRNVIYSSEHSVSDTFFRIVLFKIFNKISTWEKLERHLGEISYSSYSYELYDRLLSQIIDSGERIYSAAYIMPSGGKQAGLLGRKHRAHLKMLESMMKDQLPQKIASLTRMSDAYQAILKYPMMGPFLAYQYLIDLNYSTLCDFDEMDFIVPGPGAKDGIKKCFPNLQGLTEADVIRYAADNQEVEFKKRGINFKSLWGRPLQLIDCQNLFCEIDKYSRVYHPDIQGHTGRTRIKQKFQQNIEAIKFWYPPKWGLNEKITSGVLP